MKKFEILAKNLKRNLKKLKIQKEFERNSKKRQKNSKKNSKNFKIFLKIPFFIYSRLGGGALYY